MQTSIDQTKWYDRIWASLIFFTRLPFWSVTNGWWSIGPWWAGSRGA